MYEGVPYSKFAIVGANSAINQAIFTQVKGNLEGYPHAEFVNSVASFREDVVTGPQLQVHEVRMGLHYGLEKTATQSHPKFIICNGSTLDAVVAARVLGALDESERMYASLQRLGWPRTYRQFFVTEPRLRSGRHDALLSVLLEKRLPLMLLHGGIDQMSSDVISLMGLRYAHKIHR